jgi:hypothetical protein
VGGAQDNGIYLARRQQILLRAKEQRALREQASHARECFSIRVTDGDDLPALRNKTLRMHRSDRSTARERQPRLCH